MYFHFLLIVFAFFANGEINLDKNINQDYICNLKIMKLCINLTGSKLLHVNFEQDA